MRHEEDRGQCHHGRWGHRTGPQFRELGKQSHRDSRPGGVLARQRFTKVPAKRMEYACATMRLDRERR